MSLFIDPRERYPTQVCLLSSTEGLKAYYRALNRHAIHINRDVKAHLPGATLVNITSRELKRKHHITH